MLSLQWLWRLGFPLGLVSVPHIAAIFDPRDIDVKDVAPLAAPFQDEFKAKFDISCEGHNILGSIVNEKIDRAVFIGLPLWMSMTVLCCSRLV